MHTHFEATAVMIHSNNKMFPLVIHARYEVGNIAKKIHINFYRMIATFITRMDHERKYLMVNIYIFLLTNN